MVPKVYTTCIEFHIIYTGYCTNVQGDFQSKNVRLVQEKTVVEYLLYLLYRAFLYLASNSKSENKTK